MKPISEDIIILYAMNRQRRRTVSRRKGMMSDQLKYEIARELGVADTVKAEGWGSVSSRDCGNIVKKAIEMAERNAGANKTR
jgi:small acid-soluble spore protein F (minor alpha/beta-type SASP)